MFKTKKTQFAIRKLATGAVAVLLSFGILAGPSAPIVSAASEAIQNEMTDDTTSVVEESVPVENNTADTLTTDNTEVSANYSENTDDSTTTTVQTDTDVSTQEKTDPETSVNTEQPIQTEYFTPPLNEDVLDLDGTDENETPAGEESTEEAIAPLPKNVIEKNQKEITSTAVTEKSSETTTKPKAEVENENVTETSKEVGLPETGEDKTNLITTGIVLASIAATITALGSFINKKN
ncbi:YSIRK-type signal peptide-containing protein [Lactobacillus amylovorus]|uniref:YSIRK-type signal peptide-containing protein n=1 Tax=Lactobacillus amylovorus TaxID=1604 RepID=UPI002850E07F|nr:hypothetical protein LAYK3_09130 [Lactobacillus amylovorus]GMM21742.1 hypothetical protein LAYK10_10500 [Lactobacillus amylovorus]